MTLLTTTEEELRQIADTITNHWKISQKYLWSSYISEISEVQKLATSRVMLFVQIFQILKGKGKV